MEGQTARRGGRHRQILEGDAVRGVGKDFAEHRGHRDAAPVAADSADEACSFSYVLPGRRLRLPSMLTPSAAVAVVESDTGAEAANTSESARERRAAALLFSIFVTLKHLIWSLVLLVLLGDCLYCLYCLPLARIALCCSHCSYCSYRWDSACMRGANVCE